MDNQSKDITEKKNIIQIFGEYIYRGSDGIISILKKLCELIRDFGMPIVMFALGIYLLRNIDKAEFIPIEYRIIIALLLIIIGLGTQIWLYTRTHPRVPTPPQPINSTIDKQLERLTKLVEQLVLDKYNKK